MAVHSSATNPSIKLSNHPSHPYNYPWMYTHHPPRVHRSIHPIDMIIHGCIIIIIHQSIYHSSIDPIPSMRLVIHGCTLTIHQSIHLSIIPSHHPPIHPFINSFIHPSHPYDLLSMDVHSSSTKIHLSMNPIHIIIHVYLYF